MKRLLTCLVSFQFLHWTAAAPAVQLVKDGRPTCTVAIPDDASPQVRGAAELLVETVAASTGAKLPVVPASKLAPGGGAVHIGRTKVSPKTTEHLKGLDGDGFVRFPVDAKTLVIAGPTDWGTEFGVCEFLETCVGVRWLLPGPHGTYVPKKTDLTGPTTLIRQEPAAFSRLFSGLKGRAQLTWARRNRMHGRVQFHHQLLRLFPPETYTKTHPEFFPIRDGKRYLPANNNTHGWQPCFSAPGIVAEAVKNIKAHFAKHPDATSYSLGVSDSAGHCQCAACQAKDPGGVNFIGIRDVSDRYFEWCNAVVVGVLKDYPDKWFGCLAYRQVAQPPRRVKVHPRIIPYLTYDRLKWARPEQQAEGHKITEWWHRTSPTIGWYEYIYGTPYLLPRVYFHTMAGNYRYARRHGVRAHYAEAYPNWGEGPKLYLSLKLQWNPDRDVDALLRDWYVCCVGPDAAGDLAAYYALWEAFWTGPALKSGWFSAKGEYLRFSSPAYLNAVTPDMMVRSRALLEATVAKTKTDDQRARARLLLRAFEYYEASAYAYLGCQASGNKPIRTEQDALNALSHVGSTIGMALKRRRLVESFQDDPLLRHSLPPSRYGLLSGDAWGASNFWAVYPWLKSSQAVRDRVAALAGSQDREVARAAKAMLDIHGGKLAPVSTNPGFEQGEGPSAKGWSFWVKFAGRLRRTRDVCRSGEWSVVAEDFQRGGPHQSIPVTPGRYFGMCRAYVPKGQVSDGTVELSITMRDATGQNLGSGKSLVTPPPGRWILIAAQLDVTARSEGKDVTHVLFCPIVDGFAKGQRVYLDDCVLYRLAD